MAYALKESFLTLQGEGAQAGRLSVFLRLSGCNYWSGREADREKAPADCGRWCDTEFVGTDGDGGGRYTLEALVKRVQSLWYGNAPAGTQPYVVLTGGEPGLQVDEALVSGLHDIGAVIAIETNGSCALPEGLDWICISPKVTAKGLLGGLTTLRGNELKIVLPQVGLSPGSRLAEEALQLATGFQHLFVQQRDDAALRASGLSTQKEAESGFAACLDWIHHHPNWRLSSQTHKHIGLR